jgi:hypothetical protein
MTYQDVVNIIRNAANFVNPNGYFVHGRKSDGSLDYNQPTPHIILLEPQPNTSINNNSFFETTIFPIIFVTQDSPESTNVERENLKQEMYLLSRKLLSKIDEQPLLQQVQYTGGQPEIRQLSGTLTGFSYSLQVSYPLSECSLDLDLPPTIKLFATQTSVNAGSTIQIGWIAENVNTVNITPFGVLQGQFGFVNTVVNAETTYVGTATNSSGTATDTITIEIGATCLDATAIIKNTLGNVIATESIPSGATEDIIITDSTAVIKDSLGTTLKIENIPAEVSENITVNNTTVQLKDSANNNIGGVNSYLAESANNLTAPDGTVTVQNTTPTTIATQAVRSNGTATVTLNDITLTINDQNGNPLSVSSEKAAVNITKSVTTALTLNLTIAASTTTPVTNQSITFTGGCSNGTPTNWRWDFGDGTSSTLQNPTKSYRLTGTYTVVLSATDGTSDGFVVFASTITVTLQPLITTNLQANYDANNYDPSTGTQLDSTANAFNLTQGVVANRPSKTVGGLNGRDYITFDGTNDFLANASLSFTRATGHTIVSVIRRLRVGTLNSEWVHRSNSTPIGGVTPSFIAGNSVTPNTYVLFAGFGTNPNTPILNDWEIVVDAFNDAASAIKINNTAALLVGNAGNTAATGLQESSATNPSNYDRAQRLVYTDIKSDADINSIIQHLQAKYNLY